GGGDAALLFSRVSVRGEWIWNRFETPFTGNLDLTGYFVECEGTPLTGLSIAARWEEMLFRHVTDSNGDRHRWDEPVKRIEVGAVYRVHADLSLRASTQITSFGAAGFEDNGRVDALQLSVSF
ncbi:MAG: hypothetical protein HKN20_00820, partial [Gemmatimonadetes bacterium]|nr:hypothetical protein [Gemmatimonadota bacterium]